MEALETGKWLSRERVNRIAAISAAAGVGMLLFLWLAGHGTLDFWGKPVGSDFTAFWNAGRIANAGDPARAWNQQLLNDTIRASHGVEYGTAWIYPPVFLFLAAPLAALPYLAALFLWQLFSFVAIALVLKAILKSSRDTLIALASPLTPLVLANGQNSFLTAALLGSGLLWLERRPALAGTLFAGLVYKPQLGLIIAPLLVFTRNWKALAGAALATLALVGLSIILWGENCWPAWIDSLRYGRFYLEQGSVGFYKSASIFSAVRLWGGDTNIAYAAQALATFGAIALIWSTRSAAGFERAAAVCAAAALSTPYLLDYDIALVGIGGVFLYKRARETGFLAYEPSALALIWVAPWISRPAAEYALLPLGPVAMLTLTWLIARRARQSIAIPPLTCSVCPVT